MIAHPVRMAVSCLFVAGAVCLSGPAAHADIDLNGPWGVTTDLSGIGPSGCVLDVTQSGSTLTIAGFCWFGASVSLTGTIDPVGGALGATGTSSYCSAMSMTGTASPSSDGFDGTLTCDGHVGSFTASRCGNEVLDPGEECDPGIINFHPTLDPPCCSATCTAYAAGTPCGDAEACSARVCNGSGACTTQNAPAGTPCDGDGDVCTDDVCSGSGFCSHPYNTAPCSDGSFCTENDRCSLGRCEGVCSLCCDPGAGCTPAPASSCKGPTVPGSPFKIQLDADATAAQRVVWSWKKGAATALADFGEPRASTDYAFCVYRRRTPEGPLDLLLAADAPGGDRCLYGSGVTKECWQLQEGKGFRYKVPASDDTNEGLRKIVLRAGGAGRAGVKVVGGGSRLPAQLYAGTGAVVTQLRASNGQCWGAGYVDPAVDEVTTVGDTAVRLGYAAPRSSPSGAFIEPR